MKIRTATVAIILLSFAVFVVVSYAVSDRIFTSSFQQLELTDVRQNVERARYALEADTRNLEYFVRDWAWWDDAYDFMLDGNEGFLEGNVEEVTFTEQGLALILFVLPSGRLQWGGAVDDMSGEYVDLPEGLDQILKADSPLYTTAAEPAVSGLIDLNGETYLIASARIRRSDYSGDFRGHLIMAKMLNEEYVEELSERTRLDLTLTPLRGDAEAPMPAPPDELLNGGEIEVRFSEDGESVSGSTVLEGLVGERYRIQVVLPRSVRAVGQQALDYHLLALTVIGVLACFVTLLLIEQRVVARVRNLSTQVRRLYERTDDARLVCVPGSDELSELACEINDMIGEVDEKAVELQAMTQSLEEVNRDLYHMANTDSLTGLYNRRRVFAEMSKLVSLSLRHGHPLSVCVFDVDHFKIINDTHGHATGDRVLKKLSATVSRKLRDSDVLARIGGEEFLVLMPNTDLEGGVALCERLREAVNSSGIRVGGEVIGCTCSFGVTALRQEGDTQDAMLRRADKAMYRAKERGRDQVVGV